MVFVNVKIDSDIAEKFRDTIYQNGGQKRGEITKSLEKAMLDYIIQYSESSQRKASGSIKDE